jgi:hypothetical protein
MTRRSLLAMLPAAITGSALAKRLKPDVKTEQVHYEKIVYMNHDIVLTPGTYFNGYTVYTNGYGIILNGGVINNCIFYANTCNPWNTTGNVLKT